RPDRDGKRRLVLRGDGPVRPEHRSRRVARRTRNSRADGRVVAAGGVSEAGDRRRGRGRRRLGAEFTSQCDVRIASTRARFAWNFVHRGLVPDTGAGTWLLPRIVGLPAALRLLYSGDFLGAEEALAIGYVARV